MLIQYLAMTVLSVGLLQPKVGSQPLPHEAAPAPAKSPVKPGATTTPDPAKPLLAFPHPLITEVLYNVPTGDSGDANKDGTRQVAGDEFVELVNPHDKPINLGGYTLTDMTASEKASNGKPKTNAIRWTFPPLTLPPGKVVVVFNGHSSTIKGPLGDSSSAPAKGNEHFNGALVFSMRQPSDRIAFANTADWVMLSAPDGTPLHVIKWGEPRIKVPAGVLLVEDAVGSRAGSVQRTAANGPLAAHPTDSGVPFSPGVFAMPTPAAPIEQPAGKPANPSPDAAGPGKTPAAPEPAGPDEPPAHEPPKKPKF
ncbi:MAG: lamin tail domain-containing protein [Phycisphaerales bacterium]|nr:lamin tail domain-containing protein [Phycisphaerales bacterium]